MTDNKYELTIYSGDSQHQQMMRLQPPEGCAWNGNISVCGRPNADWLVVVERGYQTMDIFAEGGE